MIIDSPESVAALATERSMVSDGVAPQAVANYSEYESDVTFMLHGRRRLLPQLALHVRVAGRSEYR